MGRRNSIEGQLSLFPEEPSPPGPRPARAEAWPAWPQGLWVGTSSWSFPGWEGHLYQGRCSESYLARQGLKVYGAHPWLNAVGIDRGYYAPISLSDHRLYASQVPQHFRFLVKAPEALTRPITRSGELNPDFLSPHRAQMEWIGPAQAGLGAHLGCLLLQFPPLPMQLLGGAAGFAVTLYRFLEALPKGLPLAVELRNRELFGSSYQQVLQRLELSHCLSVHPSMPCLREQWQSLSQQPLWVIRWMLGSQSYSQAVQKFQPFNRLVEEDLDTRRTIVELWRAKLAENRQVMTIVNNKAEGCSPLSIERLAEAWWQPEVPF